MRDMLVVVLIGTQVLFFWPLWRRARSASSFAGISLLTEALWAVAGTGWLVYAALANDVAVAVSAVLAVCTSAMLASAPALSDLVPRAVKMRALLAAVALAVLLLVALVFEGQVALGVALAVFGVVQFVPQMSTTARCVWHRTPTPGVSAAGAAIRGTYTLGWAVYAAGPVVWGSGTKMSVPLLAWGLAGGVAFLTQAAWSAVSPVFAASPGGEAVPAALDAA